MVPPEPGLEVVIPELQQQNHDESKQMAALEVAYPNPPQQQIYEKSTMDSPGANPHDKIPNSGLETPSNDSGKRICGLQAGKFWLVFIIILLVIITIILGTVLGTRMHSSSGASSKVTATATANAGSPDLPTSALSPTPTSIRANSKLAVTGWRTGQEYSIQLFYQGPDNYIRYSTYESTSGKWAAPVMSVEARSDTPIGATAFNHSIYGGDNVLLSLN